MRRTVAIPCAALLACAPAAPPAAPPAAASPATEASAGPVAATPAPEPEAPRVRKLDLTNACSKPVRLFFGTSPSDGRGQPATVAAGATIDVPRGADGTATVWIVDDAGRGLASVSIRRRMTHVQINPDCARIDSF